MRDRLTCPVCQNKLKSSNNDGYSGHLGKCGNFVSRHCESNILHHWVWFVVDCKTKLVQELRFSLPNGKLRSHEIRINFLNHTCNVVHYQEGMPHIFQIDRLLHPDFPSLEKIGKQLSTLVLFS